MRTLLCFSLLLVAALAADNKKDKRSFEILQPSLYNTFPSSGISVFNEGASGFNKGIVSGNSVSFGSTISPAISYNSANHLFSSGVFGGSSFAGAPALNEFNAVTAAPFVTGSSVVTSAPSVVTSAPPALVSSTPFPEGFRSSLAAGYSGLNSGLYGNGLVHSYGAPLAVGYSGLNSGLYGNGLVHSYGAPLAVGYSGLNSGLYGNGLVHSYGAINQQVPVPVPQPFEVPITKTVPVPVPQPYSVPKPYAVPVGVKVPVAVPKPYEVKVPTKYPVAVPVKVRIEIPKPYPVFKTKEVKVEIERPVYVKTPVPIKVPVPVPYNVEVPQGVKVSVPQQIYWKDPKVYTPTGFPSFGAGFSGIHDFNGLAVTPSSPVLSSTPFAEGFPGAASGFGDFGSISNVPVFGEGFFSSSTAAPIEIANADSDSISVENRSGDKTDDKTDTVSTSTESPAVETSSTASEDFSSAFTSGSLFSETDSASLFNNVKESETPSEQLVNVLDDTSEKSTTTSEVESS